MKSLTQNSETVENRMYGGGWALCTHCGVKDRVDQLEPIDGGVLFRCKDSDRCARWKDSLEKATFDDVLKAARR